jgi:hypothetical protein
MAKKSSGIIGSAVAHLRRYVRGDGRFMRHGKRFEAQLPFIVTLLGKERSRARSLPTKTALVGYTRDVSETGLTLLLPSVRVGDAYLTDGGCCLRVKLDLPGGAVTMMTTSVRFEQLTRREAGCSYLLAVHIAEMQKDERERYGKYLKTAGGKGKPAHEGFKAQAAAPQAAPNGNAQLGAWDALTPASVNKAFEKFLSK